MIGIITVSSALLVLTYAGPGAAAIAPNATDLDSIGSANGIDSQSELTANVHHAERNDAGNLLSVTWSIENPTTDPVVVTWLADRTYTYSGPYFSAVTALSSDGSTRFHPIMDGSGECLCSGNTSSNFSERVEPGESMAYWSMFSVPSGVESVSIEIPGFEPIEDVPIS
ncbi:hypothetical protein [Nocardiopsis sp. NRRL B-16309]|uniref:hypothetical protein n=1 Tax=Nocardiopsis sp. NRRL B-16309 TaxID=1519494 RepID=UPI001E4CF04D|nr:hypothetical protein [Nocardiopsis sp. NRRL B-16309]